MITILCQCFPQIARTKLVKYFSSAFRNGDGETLTFLFTGELESWLRVIVENVKDDDVSKGGKKKLNV